MKKTKTLLFATSNKHKFSEVRAVLKGYGISLQRRAMRFAENVGESTRREALNKAKQAFAKFRRPLIVEDTGFYLRAYRNFPGTHPKRIFDAIGYDGFFRLLKGKRRDAYAETSVCYIASPNKQRVFSGRMHGKITSKVFRPNADVMPYERIFVPRGECRVIAEMSRAEKNAISHRGKAARKLGKFISG